MLGTRFAAVAALLLLVGMALPEAPAQDKKKPDDNKGDKVGKLDGTYTIVSGKRDGMDLPKKDFEHSVVVFQGNKIFGHDKDKKEFFGATFKIDASSKPWKISMISTSPKKGEPADGVIEVSGDTIRLAYNLPGGKVPTSFDTEKKQQAFTLKRVESKDKDKPKSEK